VGTGFLSENASNQRVAFSLANNRIMEIFFYHLTSSRLEDALPSLLSKTLQKGWRAVVQAGSEERVKQLDDHLWTFSENSFLPHSAARNGFEADQPIWLTAENDNPNKAELRFYVDRATLPKAADLSKEAYQRVILMFHAFDEEEVQEARRYWKELKDNDFQPTYWKQQPDGAWKKQA
jgi:DNA polymerase-3 subunit chi